MAREVYRLPPGFNSPKKNVGIYSRVSKVDRNQLNSLTAQISGMIRRVADIDQWTLSDAFIDIASAKTGSERKGFDRMIAACERKQISVILTKSISRFGRDTVETLEALRRMKEAGARVIFEQERLDTDELTSELIISMIEAVTQAENESRSYNIRWGLRSKARQGISGLYKRRLYGYKKTKDGDLILDEEQAKAVRKIFRWYMEGESVLGIVKKLQLKRISSPTGKETWSKHMIETMLSNRKYTGAVSLLDSLNRDCEYMIKDVIPPIISEGTFQRVQKMREKRSNITIDENGIAHRRTQKYSSKRKKRIKESDTLKDEDETEN